MNFRMADVSGLIKLCQHVEALAPEWDIALMTFAADAATEALSG
jgi:hypothetical protein